MNRPHAVFSENEIKYTGAQLASHWIFRNFDVLGDGIVAFIGPCDVLPEYMKDVQDLREEARIYSERMLHFIVEHFDPDLGRAVLRQRVLMALMAESLNRRIGEPRIRRIGSDLYDGESKLTVSIASASPVSALIQAGINISSRNTPVPTRGLEDYGIAPRDFGEEILAAYAEECDGAARAVCKARPCE